MKYSIAVNSIDIDEANVNIRIPNNYDLLTSEVQDVSLVIQDTDEIVGYLSFASKRFLFGTITDVDIFKFDKQLTFETRETNEWSITLPYKIGTFVKVTNPGYSNEYGTVAAYTVGSHNEYCVWVSGYREPCTMECLPNQLVPLTQEEIERLKQERD